MGTKWINVIRTTIEYEKSTYFVKNDRNDAAIAAMSNTKVANYTHIHNIFEQW